MVGHGQHRLAAQAASHFGGSMADGGKAAFDAIAGSDELPMLGRDVVEGQNVRAVLGHSSSRLKYSTRKQSKQPNGLVRDELPHLLSSCDKV